MKRRTSQPVALWGCLLLAGCGSCGSRSAEESAPEEVAVPEPPPRRLGTLRGVVRLAPDAEPPLYPASLIHGRESAGTWPEVCAPPKTGDRRPTPVGEDRVLGNVALTLTTPSEHRPAFLEALGIVDGAVQGREPVEHVVTIEDCRMRPAFLTATKSDTVTIVNETDYPYFPRFGRSPFQQSMNRGERRSNPLERAGNLSLDCGGFGAACGRTDVVVMFHPAHATSAADGSFAIEVPADIPLVLHGWHPLYEETRMDVSVPARGEVTVEVVMKPGPALPDPSPPRDPDAPPPEDELELF